MTNASSLRGIAVMTAGAGLLTLNDAASKYLTEYYSVGQVVCLRQAAAIVFMLPYAWAVTGIAALRPVNHGGQLLRGLLFVGSTAFTLTGLSLLPLSFVTVVLFSGPLFVALMSAPMQKAPGKEALLLTVEYPPGGADPVHRHDAEALVYVLEGSIVMGVAGSEPVTLSAGQTFHEGPADVHTIGRNASDTKPAKFVVFLVKDIGKPALIPVD